MLPSTSITTDLQLEYAYYYHKLGTWTPNISGVLSKHTLKLDIVVCLVRLFFTELVWIINSFFPNDVAHLMSAGLLLRRSLESDSCMILLSYGMTWMVWVPNQTQGQNSAQSESSGPCWLLRTPGDLPNLCPKKNSNFLLVVDKVHHHINCTLTFGCLGWVFDGLMPFYGCWSYAHNDLIVSMIW